MAAVREHGTPRADNPTRLAGVEAQGLDETAVQAASARRSTSFVAGIVDLTRRWDGPALLLDVVDDRSASTLVSWINQRDPLTSSPKRLLAGRSSVETGRRAPLGGDHSSSGRGECQCRADEF